MGILHAPLADSAKATCRRTILRRLSLALLIVAGLSGIGVVAQVADEFVTTGSVFEIGENEVGDIGPFTAKPKVYGLYDHPVTKKVGMKAAAKFIAGLGTGTVQCEWTKRIPLYDKKLLSAANKAATFTAAWLALPENAAQNQPLPLALNLGSKQVDPALPVRTVHLSPPLIYTVEITGPFFTITGRWFGTKKPKVWFEYRDAKNCVKRVNCKIEKPDGQEGRVDAKLKPIYMNPVDGSSKVVIQPPRLPNGVAWNDLSHVVVDSGSGLAADTELYAVTFNLDGKGTRTGGGELLQAVKHGQAATAPEVEANAGWTYTGWDVAFDNVIEPLVVTAQYDLNTYLLTYTAGSNGLVNGAAQVTQVVAYGGNGPSVEAQPSVGYHFTTWSDGILTAARQDTSVTGPITVTANFAPTYLLTGTVSGDVVQSVTVTLSGDAALTTTTDIGGEYSIEVPAGTYTVTPSHDGYVFTPSIRDVAIADADSPGNDFVSLGGGDGTYLAVDLVTGATANLTLPPPDMPTSVEYKTTKMVFRRIPAGTFTMGSPAGELGRFTNETQHTVQLTQDYYLGVFEVTQAQYFAVMGTWPSYLNNPAYRDTRPVETVSWDTIRGGTWPSGDPAANSFMDKLRTLVGAGYPFDLPTEAQWEYACRAGTTTALNRGKNLTSTDSCPNVAEVGRYWHNGGSSWSGGRDEDLSVATAAAGSYLPNAWGLYDMHGNVWEWCLDWYVADLGVDPVVDPAGAATGSTRVIRGGGLNNDARACRSAIRGGITPSGAADGFRVAFAPQD
jgi:formylglycine-generating enzyme required for sulfatase activity